MTRSLIAIVCVPLLVTLAPAQNLEPSIQQQMLRFQAGNKLEVQLRTGQKLKGTLLSTGEKSFELQPEKQDAVARSKSATTVAYQDVQSVKKSGMSGLKKKVLITGIIVGAIFGGGDPLRHGQMFELAITALRSNSACEVA